jgi:metallo-beta-lactamase class B
MKKLIIALVALFPLAGAAQAQTLKDLLATLTIKWNKPTEPFRMIGNVYYVGTDGLASYLITSPQGHLPGRHGDAGRHVADQGEH